MSNLLSLAHAAAVSGTHEWILDLAIRNGSLEACERGGHRYITARALRTWQTTTLENR